MSRDKKYNHYIQIGVHMDEKFGIRSVTIDENTTHLVSDSQLIKNLCVAILKAISLNNDDVMVQDLLNSIDLDD